MEITEHTRCAGIGHTYIDCWARYCAHEQRWTVTWRSYRDVGGSAGTELLHERVVELGPFDTTPDALLELHQGLDELAKRLQL